MADIRLHSGLTLFEAHRLARDTGMYLIGDGHDIKISPIIPPGWHEVPIRVRVASPTRGTVQAALPQVAA